MPDPKKEAPDKDKLPEDEGKEGLIDDTEAVPDMAEGEELSEEEAAKKEASEVSDTEIAEEEELDPELKRLMEKKGYKSPAEVAKAFNALERERTKLEQERRMSSLLPADIPARPKTKRELKPYPKLEKDPMDMTKEEYEQHRTQEREALKDELSYMYTEAEADKEYRRTYASAMTRINKDPEKFQRLKPIMNDLRYQYPQANFDQLYEQAEGLEKDVSKRRKEEVARELFGEDVDMDKLGTLLAKTRPAVISGAGGTGADKTKRLTREQAEKKLKDDIFGKDAGLIRE